MWEMLLLCFECLSEGNFWTAPYFNLLVTLLHCFMLNENLTRDRLFNELCIEEHWPVLCEYPVGLSVA